MGTRTQVVHLGEELFQSRNPGLCLQTGGSYPFVVDTGSVLSTRIEICTRERSFKD